MREFYLGLFDCSSSPRYTNLTTGFSSYFLTFPQGGARIELMTNPALKHTESPAWSGCGYAHVALSLGNEERVRELTESLRLKGVTIKAEPRRTGDGYFESVIADPDGNLIELTV